MQSACECDAQTLENSVGIKIVWHEKWLDESFKCRRTKTEYQVKGFCGNGAGSKVRMRSEGQPPADRIMRGFLFCLAMIASARQRPSPGATFAEAIADS